MRLWAIIPTKPLRRAKSRLAGVMSVDERFKLNQMMLDNTLKAVTGVSEISTVLVVSRDPVAHVVAKKYDARVIRENRVYELNIALKRAILVAQTYGSDAVLILPGDLPLIKPLDVRELILSSGKPPEIVIAPDRRNDGINALLINPPDLVDNYLGAGSFYRHSQEAKMKNIRLGIYRNPAFALDIDVPEDLDLYKKIESGQITLAESLGLAVN